MDKRCHYCNRDMIWRKKDKFIIEHKISDARREGNIALAEKLKLERRKFRTSDHVVPRCDGGLSVNENIVSSCMECNINKGPMSYNEFLYISRFGPKLCHEPVRLMLAETLGVTVEDLKTRKQKKREKWKAKKKMESEKKDLTRIHSPV